MDAISMEELKGTFLSRYPDWCVSLFMPTHRAGRQTRQDPIRLKNLLRSVDERLAEKGLRPPEVQEMLKGPGRLLHDRAFWQHQSDGLALFFSKEAFHSFRLPLPFEELVVIANRFHVKPLLPILTSDAHFYILALSRNRIRLLEGTRHTVDEIDTGDLLRRLEEAFPSEPPERQLQFHTRAPAGKDGRAAMFHGHDPGDEAKGDILRRFRMIDKELPNMITGARSPVVLAGVEYLLPIYREASAYPHLAEQGIPGNPEGLKPEELHGQAWSIVEPLFEKAREKAADQYRRSSGTGLTTTGIREAVSSAHQGRVDVLFVAVGVQVWGDFDPGAHEVHVHREAEPGDEDLLDLAAITTILNGGTVYAVDREKVPGHAPLAAVFRY
ncbi:MAG: hypothetical protein JXL84_06920 [Deltaproteobacteria bacterium]|nr:hypothetical protein [Deltaproteobacteria bacterium]